MDSREKIKELADKLQKAESIIKSICEIQGMYLIDEPKEKIFDFLLYILLKEANSEYGFIGEILYDEKGNPYLKTFAITNISWSPETRKFYEDNAPTGLEFRNLDTLFGETLKTGKIVISNDPPNDPRGGGIPDGHPPLNSYLGVPLYINKRMIGMFGISNKEGGYNQEVIDRLNPIINSVAQLVFAQRKNCRGCDK
jgi:GAF domain-containing protein